MAAPSYNYGFIDNQNLSLGVKTMGWQVDYKKLRLCLSFSTPRTMSRFPSDIKSLKNFGCNYGYFLAQA